MTDRPTHGWCPDCKEESAIDGAANCLWCDAATVERKRGGWKRPDLKAKRRLTDGQLRALHILHVQGGVSVRELGRRVHRKAGYASAASAAMSITEAWRGLGLHARSRSEAAARMNRERAAPDSPGTADRAVYKRWRRRRNGGYRVCKARKLQSPGKGDPCTRYALVGSDYCHAHDPARRSALGERLAAIRARVGVA